MLSYSPQIISKSKYFFKSTKQMPPKLYIRLTVLLIKLQWLVIVFGAVFESSINVCEHVSDYIFIQNIEDCSKYFVCINGQPIAQQCRSGLYFDGSRQACVASRNSCLQCPKQSRKNIPLLKTCDKYVSCYFGNIYLRKCENQQQFNRITGKCDLAKNVDCVDNRCSIHTFDKNVTYVASAAKCDSYFVCQAGQVKAFTCANGLYFSTKCNCCELRANVDCMIEEDEAFVTGTKEKRFFTTDLVEKLHLPKLLNANVNIKCPKTGSFIYPYNGNPEYYYTCLNGVASLKSCAEGFQFNDTHKRCMRQSTTQEHDLMTNSEFNLAVKDIELFDIKCPEYGATIMPHIETKEKYIVCMNGQATVFECAEGLFYNDKFKSCSSENNLDDIAIYHPALKTEIHNIMCPKFGTFKYPHANATHYYLCTDGKVYVLACDSGEIFDSEVNICRPKPDIWDNNSERVEENVGDEPKATILAEFASNIICPKVGTFMFPHNQRNRYYVCIDGHAIGFACAAGYVYNAEINACKPENQTVNYDIPAPISLDEPVNILCPTTGASKFPHVHKHKFYLCINGMGSVLACPNGTSFDVESLNCRNFLEEVQEDLVDTNATELAKHTVQCPKLGTFVYSHENETQYYVCLDGKSIVLTCNEGQYFNSKEKVCRALNKDKVEHIKAMVNAKEKTSEFFLTNTKIDLDQETPENQKQESTEFPKNQEILTTLAMDLNPESKGEGRVSLQAIEQTSPKTGTTAEVE